jgi:hypothetical protein
MAASDSSDDSEHPRRGSIEYLSGPALRERLEEEVNRAGRHGTALSCLLIEIEDLREVRRAHGEVLADGVLGARRRASWRWCSPARMGRGVRWWRAGC